jgi:hypothetical protein
MEGTAVLLNKTAMVIGGFEGTESDPDERSLTNAQGVVTNYTVIDGDSSYSCLTISGGDVWLDTIAFSNSNNWPPQASESARIFKKTGAGTLVMNNCRIEKNNMRNGFYGRFISGIGAYFSGGSVRMTGCVVSDINQTYRENNGIGIYATNTNLTISNCLFHDNRADGDMSSGGALSFVGGALRVARTEFRGNSAGRGEGFGGGALLLGGNTTASFSNCLFAANLMKGATGKGGAVWVNVSAGYGADFVNCTFAANTNSLPTGGAVCVSQGSAVFRNCILWTNQALGGDSGGMEIYAEGADSSAFVSYSCLTGTEDPYLVAVGGAALSLGDGILTADPLFAGGADVHLQSKTGRWDPLSGSRVKDSFHSPCIDKGDPGDGVGDEPDPTESASTWAPMAARRRHP